MVLNLSDLSELLHLYTPLCALRSANQMLLTVPKIFYKSRGHRAFAVLDPKMWIELLLEVRQVPSLIVLYSGPLYVPVPFQIFTSFYE